MHSMKQKGFGMFEMQRQYVNLWLPLVVGTEKYKQSCLRFVISIWLETGIPAKISRPPGFYNAPLKIPQESTEDTHKSTKTLGLTDRDRL